VSLIREVISGVERRALVNILGGGKLAGLAGATAKILRVSVYGKVAIDSEQRDICSRCRERRDIVEI
jgi:hypothetical protein